MTIPIHTISYYPYKNAMVKVELILLPPVYNEDLRLGKRGDLFTFLRLTRSRISSKMVSFFNLLNQCFLVHNKNNLGYF